MCLVMKQSNTESLECGVPKTSCSGKRLGHHLLALTSDTEKSTDMNGSSACKVR